MHVILNRNPIHFTDDKFVCYLPSILTDNPYMDTSYIAKEDTFSDYLNYVLQALARLDSDKKYKYELKFNLYLHSNKRSNLDRNHIVGVFPEYISVLMEYVNMSFFRKLIYRWRYIKQLAMSNNIIFEDFQYHGYGQISLITLNIKEYSNNNYTKLIKLCINSIFKAIKDTNKDASSNEFIEFDKWVLLEVRRTPTKVSNSV